MKIPSPRANKKARIEIIPLIDIIFFLLATFVMVSLSMVKNKGIPVNLPVAATGTPQERKDFTSITVTENGEFLFNKEKIDRSQLSEKLSQLKASNPDSKVFINGDAKAAFENIVSVLDEARKLGITKVAIETKPRPPKS
jgi:biopolymer transport protein ExbD